MEIAINVDSLVKQAAAALKQGTRSSWCFIQFQCASNQRTGNQEQCMSHCNTILSTCPDHVEALYLRGSAQQKTDVHAAVLDYDAVLRAQPGHHRAALARGACKNMCGDFVGAIGTPSAIIHASCTYAAAYCTADYELALKNEPDALPSKQDLETHHHPASSPKLIKAARHVHGNTDANPDVGNVKPHKRSHFSIAPLLQAHVELQDAYRAAGEHRDQGDWEAARVLYDALLARDPHHFRAMFHRGYVCSKMGCHDDAVRDYTTALAMQPDSIVARFNRSTVLDAVGRHAEAVADLDAVLQADPDNADAWHNRGVARSHMGDEVNALADYDNALSINPNHARALRSRAACHAVANTQESLTQAAADYARAIEVDADADTCCQRAQVLIKVDRLPEALKDLTRALVLCPGHVPALRARAHVLQLLGQQAGAADDLAAAAAGDPEDAELQLLAAHALRGQGQWAEAVVACQRAISLEPTNVDALSCKAYCLRKQDKLQEAANGYQTALDAVGPDADTAVRLRLYNSLGYCLAMQGNLQAAVASYSAALALEPCNTHALHNRGMTHMQAGDAAAAACDFEALITLDPANQVVRKQLEAAVAQLRGNAVDTNGPGTCPL